MNSPSRKSDAIWLPNIHLTYLEKFFWDENSGKLSVLQWIKSGYVVRLPDKNGAPFSRRDSWKKNKNKNRIHRAFIWLLRHWEIFFKISFFLRYYWNWKCKFKSLLLIFWPNTIFLCQVHSGHRDGQPRALIKKRRRKFQKYAANTSPLG